MGSAKAVRAGRGFIVKHAGEWFRVPKKLVRNGTVDAGDLTKHLDAQRAARAARGKKWNKPAKRGMFLGKTPGHSSPQTGRLVKERMATEGTYRTRKQGRKRLEEVEFPQGSGQWHDVNDCDMAHRVDAVDFWNNGAPPAYPTPGRLAGPRSPYVRDFMTDPSMYELMPLGPNRSAGANLDNYQDPLA